MTDDQLLTLLLGLAIARDTDVEYGKLCDAFVRRGALYPWEVDQLYAHEWLTSRVRDIDSEALARQSLEREDARDDT